jgi:hypothetical protein
MHQSQTQFIRFLETIEILTTVFICQRAGVRVATRKSRSSQLTTGHKESEFHFREHPVSFEEHSVNFTENTVNFREHLGNSSQLTPGQKGRNPSLGGEKDYSGKRKTKTVAIKGSLLSLDPCEPV